MTQFTTARCQFLVDYLDLPEAAQVEDAVWEPFQIAHLEDDSTFRSENKARQIAWSFTAAADAIADAVLFDTSSVFVSINQDEAKEKIRYARRVYRNIRYPPFTLPSLVRNNELGLEFDNGARLISLPSKPPRGKAKMNVFLDEFAHVQHDRRIYTAALPIISKGGRLRMASSPMGASGVFWEVFTESMQAYPGYVRKTTPWWEVNAFCTDVREAIRLAPGMPTAERVERFGTDTIKAIFANMLLEDFQQEYECTYVDEVSAWITWDEIKVIQQADLLCRLVACQEKQVDAALSAIEWLARTIPTGDVEPSFAAGYDVGRTRNTSELYVVGLNSAGLLPLRLAITLDRTPFDEQYDVVTYALQRLPITKLYIDRNGIGMNLAENASRRFPGKAEGVDFTNESKRLWATETKMLVQQRKASIPIDRDLAYQIHSIKRQVTPSKNLIFDTEKNEKHHADKFWAWSLAHAAAKQPTGPRRRTRRTA